LAATNYDNAFDFSSQVTYFVPDEVIYIQDPDDPSEPNRIYDEDILDAIVRNLESRGYELVEDNDPFNADLVIAPYVWTTTSTGVVVDYCFWYPWWCGYNPWYPWGGYVYEYTYGTVLVDIIDRDGIVIEDEELIPIVWTGALNGAVSDNRSDVRQRINQGIDQCFEQSPYLTRAE
jgi:hypothetical protein